MKKIHKSFSQSKEKVILPLQQIHLDIYDQFSKLQGNSIYNLTFLDEATHYIFAISISDKSFDIVKREFTQ